jgi:hypothetical protein
VTPTVVPSSSIAAASACAGNDPFLRQRAVLEQSTAVLRGCESRRPAAHTDLAVAPLLQSVSAPSKGARQLGSGGNGAVVGPRGGSGFRRI